MNRKQIENLLNKCVTAVNEDLRNVFKINFEDIKVILADNESGLSNVFVNIKGKEPIKILENVNFIEVSKNGTIQIEDQIKGVEFYNFWGEQCFAPGLSQSEKLVEIKDDFTRILHISGKDLKDDGFLCHAIHVFRAGVMQFAQRHNEFPGQSEKVNAVDLFAEMMDILDDKIDAYNDRDREEIQDFGQFEEYLNV